MKQRRWSRVWAFGMILSLLTGCSTQAVYMQGWQAVERFDSRWTAGSLRAERLSSDEAAVYQELGTPDAIRFFRTMQTRQRVFAWIYENPERVFWFVDRGRVPYVAVDTNISGSSKEARETLQNKLVAGGALAAAIGGFTAGILAFGKDLGLKD